MILKSLPNKRLAADARERERFDREIRAVCDIDHPNVVRVIDADVHEGVPYYAMEYVPGLDCAALVGQMGALATGDACEIARQTACALDWVHAHGVVHRDVNPSNLLLGIDGDVRLLDFGLAIRWPGPLPDASLDGRHPVPGTPDFVAPEVILNPSAVDPLSDVYALGCTLYYLLSGESPFPCRAKNGADAKMAAHAMTPFPSIQATRNKVPSGLASLLRRMVAKSPRERPTAGETATALAEWTFPCDCGRIALHAIYHLRRSERRSRTVRQAGGAYPPPGS